MRELSVPAALEQIDPVLSFLEQALTRQGCPTVLRLRMGLVVEELFSAALACPDPGEVRVTCAVGQAPGEVAFRFSSPQGPLSPDLSDLEGLQGLACTYGLSFSRRDDVLVVSAGRRPR